jgi:hypothetical protein
MSVTVQVLFGRPQHEIASLLCDRLTRCSTASLIAGFMTVEGIAAIAAPFRIHPGKLTTLVVGAGTWRAFDALDRLVLAGVSPGALHVHLGHTRPSGTVRHPFHRYHPMLHSKVYLLEMGAGEAVAFVGSHNLTGFALKGLNGEAGVLLEGPAAAPEFAALRQHVAEATRQAVQYDPGMKEAYAWWTMQFIDGLYVEANSDLPKDSENMRTIVVLAARASGAKPRPGEIIYFEIPEALDRIQSMQAEVHIYLFSALPASAAIALAALGAATARISCKVEGIESGRGGIELRADWQIDNRRYPDLKRTVAPFRPTTASGMQQVRVRVERGIARDYEYLFDPGKIAWAPIYDPEGTLAPEEPGAEVSENPPSLMPLEQSGRLYLPWQRVRGLKRAKTSTSDPRQIALWESTPESEAFILFSLRRRRLERPKSPSDQDKAQ